MPYFPDNDPFDDETWRDPTDDWQRAVYYVLFVFGFLAGIGLIVAGIAESLKPGFLGTSSWDESRALRWITILFGSFLVIGISLFFKKESKHWSLKTMTLDRFVAGLAIGTLAVAGLFVYIVSESPRTLVFLPQAGLVVLFGVFLTFVVGLGGAFLPLIFPKIQRIDGVFISEKVVKEDSRAKDSNLDVDDDPVRSRYLVIRNHQFGERPCRVLTDIYEAVEPGCMGNVKIVNGVIREFKVTRRG